MTGVSTADRVRRLIEHSSLSQADFAQRVGLDNPKLSKSLSGTRRFSSLDLARIAEFGHTTVDELLGVSSPAPALAARTATAIVDSRAVDLALASARKYAEAREDLALLRGDAALPPLCASPDRHGLLVEQGARLAAQALALLESPDRVLTRDLATVVEQKFACDVAVVDLVSGFDGLALQANHVRLIVVGTSRVPGRQRFTLAHELGHLFAGDHQDLHVDEDVTDRTRGRDPSEMRANAFAASFLMPEAILLEAAKDGLSDLEFATLSCAMSVSPSSLAWRLLSLGLIENDRRMRLGSMSALSAAQIAGETSAFAEWVEQVSRPRLPTRLLSEMLRAYLEGKATLRPFANLVDVPVDAMEAALGNAEGMGSPEQ